MNVAVGTGLAFAVVAGVCLFVLWFGSAVLIDKLEDRLEVLERNWAEQFGAPAEDDSPEAEEAEEFDPSTFTIEPPPNPTTRTIATVPYPDDAQTDEIPIAPATVPDGMPLAVQSALIEQRPSPVPRGKSAEWVERTVNIGGTLQTYRIPAKREEAS